MANKKLKIKMRYKTTDITRKALIVLTDFLSCASVGLRKFKFIPNADLYASSTVLSAKLYSFFAWSASLWYS